MTNKEIEVLVQSIKEEKEQIHNEIDSSAKEIEKAKKILQEKEQRENRLDELESLLRFVYDQCTHEWEYMGSDHRDTTYRCKICGTWRTV